MAKFTAQIDLSNYFEDERKQVLLLVDPAAMATVADLLRRVETTFELENVGFICKATGCYILPQEAVEIVQHVKVLRAFARTTSADDVVSKPKKTKKLKLKHVEAELELCEQVQLPDKERQKEEEAAFAFATPLTSLQQKKRKYIDESHQSQQSNKSNEKSSNSSSISGVHVGAAAAAANAAHKSKKPKTRATAEDLKAVAAAAVAPATLCEEESKLKRKRSRSKRQKSQEHSATEQLSMDTSAPLQNTSQHFGTSKSHIYFNATGGAVTVNASNTANKTTSSSGGNTTKNNTSVAKQLSSTRANNVSVNVSERPAEISPKILFRCNLSEISFKQARIFPIKPTKNGGATANKSPIIIQEHIVIKPATTNSLLFAVENKATSYSAASVEDVPVEPSQVHDESSPPTAIDINENSNSSIEVVAEEEENEEASSRLLESSVDQQQRVAGAAAVAAMSNVVDLDEGDEEEQSDLDDSEVCLIETTETENAITQMEPTAGRDSDFTTANVEITIEKILPFSLPLNKLPDVGDILIFKMYRLDNACTPAISNFIAGKCEYTNKRTKMIKLFIIEGHGELSSLPSKFASILDDSRSENNYLNVKMSELLEARVFQMS